MSSKAVFFLLLVLMLCITGLISTCMLKPKHVEAPPPPPRVQFYIPSEKQQAASELVQKLVVEAKDKDGQFIDRRFNMSQVYDMATDQAVKIFGEPVNQNIKEIEVKGTRSSRYTEDESAK